VFVKGGAITSVSVVVGVPDGIEQLDIISNDARELGGSRALLSISASQHPTNHTCCYVWVSPHGQVNAARASEKEMQRRVEGVERELQSCRDELSEAINKREEAEAAKFSCEAALRAKRLERKSLSHSGHLNLNGGHQSTGKFMNPADRQGSLNGICFEDSQSSSPSRSSFSFASFASPGRSERSPMESSIAQALTTPMPASQDKPRKLKLSDKIGAYFIKKKILV